MTATLPSSPTASGERPPPSPRPSWLSNLRHDVPASLVVFLVAVPLSLGIAVASNAPLTAGLIAAAVGGIVAGALGGSPMQVSGPAAGLTVIVADLVTRFGWGVTCLITAVAGVIQIVLGITKTGRAALAISPAVVHGMLAGIGLTIVLGQLHVVLGGQQQGSPVDNILGLPSAVLDLAPVATALGFGVIAILLLWPRLPKSTPGWLKGIPAPLLAVAAVTAVAALFALPAERVDVGGPVLEAITPPVLPDSQSAAVVVGVLTIAIIASIESLLSAVAVDRMHDGPKSNLNKELIGQGAGNTVSGMLGGLPITGVIVRSTANVAAGAKSRNSAILHGVWIVVFSLLLLDLVQQIPMAVLAGLLVVIGARLVNPEHMKDLAHHGELPVYVVTLAAVVLTDLLTGVLVGLGLALLLVLRRVVWASIEVQAPTEEGGAWRVVVEGALSFLSIPRLSRALGQVPEGADAVVDLVTDYLDHAAYDHLSEWVARQRVSGGSVSVDEVGTMGLADRSEDAVPQSRLGGPGDRRPGHVPRFFSPWSTWQAGHDGAYGPGHGHGHGSDTAETVIGQNGEADPILTGLREYHRRAAGLVAPYLSDLAEHTAPHALFLTCADSRVVPNVITSSGPGDLFTVRNVGNLAPVGDDTGRLDLTGAEAAVPAHGDDSVAASVEYAVDVLGVPTIVVCGHSGCGAMSAALASDGTGEGALARWLTGADASVSAWRDGHEVGRAAAAEGRDELDQLAMVNVAVQLRRLAEHPVVARALAEDRVRLVGLYFDIPVARMMVLDETGPSEPKFVRASSDRLGSGSASSRVDATPTEALPVARPAVEA